MSVMVGGVQKKGVKIQEVRMRMKNNYFTITF